MRLGFYDDCDLGDRLKERGDLVLLPPNFSLSFCAVSVRIATDE